MAGYGRLGISPNATIPYVIMFAVLLIAVNVANTIAGGTKKTVMTAELRPIFSCYSLGPPEIGGRFFGGRVRGYIHGDEASPEGEIAGRRPQIDSEIFEWESLSMRQCSAPASKTGASWDARHVYRCRGRRRVIAGLARWRELNGLDMELIHAALGSDEDKVDFVIFDDPAKQYGRSIIYSRTQDG